MFAGKKALRNTRNYVQPLKVLYWTLRPSARRVQGVWEGGHLLDKISIVLGESTGHWW